MSDALLLELGQAIAAICATFVAVGLASLLSDLRERIARRWRESRRTQQ